MADFHTLEEVAAEFGVDLTEPVGTCTPTCNCLLPVCENETE